jgi:hypothetical protein
MFDPAYTDLYIIGLMLIVVVVAQFIQACIITARIEAAERRILAELSLDIEDDIPPWTPADGPVIDEKEFG